MKIYEKISSLKNDIYKVTFKNGYTIEGTGHHPVLVNKTGRSTYLKYEWAGLADLKPGEHIVLNHKPCEDYNTDIEYFEWSADGILTVQEGRTPYHYIATLSQEKWQAYKENNYWNPDHIYCAEDNSLTFTHPETMNFWLELIDPNSDIGKFSIKAIGHRPKVVNDSNVKAIYFRETPPILLVPASQNLTLEQKKAQGYVIINIPSYYEEYFDISSKGKSAKDEMDNLLYTHTYYQDSITISAIPIYHLEPNTRITVTDEKSGIYGDYLIKSFSLPLTHDGMMSITASRAVTRIV